MPANIGDRIKGRYHIVELIGEGGMGAVYRVLDELTGDYCALKESRLDGLPSEDDVTRPRAKGDSTQKSEVLTRERAAAMFKREAQLLNTLRHPNLPRVSDFFTTPEETYLVMDLIEGADLARQLDERGGKAFDEAAVLGWTLQLLDALAYCHAHGVIHRDVKPSNIIVKAGRAYLVDFGIAKVVGGGTTTISAITSGYSGPENYSRNGTADIRSDIYALGATVYTLLAAVVPPDAGDLSAGRVALDPPPEAIPGVSPATALAIKRAMSLKLSDRYGTADEMRLALSTTAVAAVAQLTERPLAPPKRHNRLPALLGVAAFVGVSALVLPRLGQPDASGMFSIAPRATNSDSIGSSSGSTQGPAPPASPTTLPVPTNTAAPVPATATLNPTSTPLPTPTQTPTPCPRVDNFYGLGTSLLQQLGCGYAAVSSRFVVTQRFQSGFMVVFDDDANSDFKLLNQKRRFYAVANNGRVWRVFFERETDSLSILNSSNPDDWYSCQRQPGRRPEQSGVPWRGFGKVWCDYSVVRNTLGYVIGGSAEEKSTASFQSYDNGRAFKLFGRVYTVLFDPAIDLSKEAFVEGIWK